MGFALPWIEVLTCALLVAALAAAQGARMRRWWARWLLMAAADLPALALFVTMAVVSLSLYTNLHLVSWTVPATLGLIVCYLAGILWMERRGRKPRPGRTNPAEWPRGRLAVALAAAAGLGVLTFWVLDLSRYQRADAIQAEAAAMALALAPARVPDEQNAALDYQQACKRLNAPSDANSEESWGEDRQEAWWSLLRGDANDSVAGDPNLLAHLKHHEPTLRLIRRAAAKDACYFEYDYQAPCANRREPDAYGISKSARLLALSARSRAYSGDSPGAVEDLRAVFRLAEHAASGPFIECILWTSSVDELGWDALQWGLSSGRLKAPQLAGVELRESVSYQRQCDRTFRMKEAIRLGTYGALAARRIGTWDLGIGRTRWGPEPQRKRLTMDWAIPLYRILLLETDVKTERRISELRDRLANQPYHKTCSQWKAVDDALMISPSGLLARIFYLDQSGSARMAAEADARRRVLRIVLGACRYHAARGRLPERAEDLAGEFLIEVPIDPFDGKPIRCVRDGKGLVVYSIGRDFADNGGAAWDRDKRTGDLAFRLPG